MRKKLRVKTAAKKLHLPSFIRLMRRAQLFSQNELANKIEVTQSALAQYERSEATLSLEKLEMIATILNLNPEILFTEAANPFKPAQKGDVICLRLSTISGDEIDFRLIKYISDYNTKATFQFIKSKLERDHDAIKKRQSNKRECNAFAIAILDSEGNNFLFFRKDAILFDECDLIELLKKQAFEECKNFDISLIEDESNLYDKIKTENFSKIALPFAELKPSLDEICAESDSLFLETLIERVTAFDSDSEAEQRRMKAKLKIMDKDFLKVTNEHLLRRMLPIVKQYI